MLNYESKDQPVWLPGGKCLTNEDDPETCAIREVSEETGMVMSHGMIESLLIGETSYNGTAVNESHFFVIKLSRRNFERYVRNFDRATD